MADKEITRSVTVLNHGGVHLRAASILVTSARRFQSAISVVKGNHTADVKSTPLQLLALGAAQGEMLELRAKGLDAKEALDALAGLFADSFGELAPDEPEPKRSKRSNKTTDNQKDLAG